MLSICIITHPQNNVHLTHWFIIINNYSQLVLFTARVESPVYVCVIVNLCWWSLVLSALLWHYWLDVKSTLPKVSWMEIFDEWSSNIQISVENSIKFQVKCAFLFCTCCIVPILYYTFCLTVALGSSHVFKAVLAFFVVTKLSFDKLLMLIFKFTKLYVVVGQLCTVATW